MSLDETMLARLEQLCRNVEAPWKLVPCGQTVTGTIILHDANEVAIADLYTEGSPTAVDELIAIAPTAIAELVTEVRRLRALANTLERALSRAPCRPTDVDCTEGDPCATHELLGWPSVPQQAHLAIDPDGEAHRRLLDLLAGWRDYVLKCSDAENLPAPNPSPERYLSEFDAITELYQWAGCQDCPTDKTVHEIVDRVVRAALLGPTS